MNWNEMSRAQKIDEWLRKNAEMLDEMTPYEKDCMWKVNFQGADCEPLDPVAKKVVDDALDRFNDEWKRERESRPYASDRPRIVVTINTRK